MKEVTLYRSDFTDVQDGSGDSMFDTLLEMLGEMDTRNIETLEMKVESFTFTT